MSRKNIQSELNCAAERRSPNAEGRDTVFGLKKRYYGGRPSALGESAGQKSSRYPAACCGVLASPARKRRFSSRRRAASSS